MPAIRIAVLVSGRGSNLQALLDAIGSGALDAEVVGVFSDRPAAHALERVPARLRWSLDARSLPKRGLFDQALADAVADREPDWVLCAGYMRILGSAFVERFRGRLLNIHPSLLPRHRGLHTHHRALAAGDAEHGASMHFVIPELDAGSVIAHARIPIDSSDTAEILAQRLLPVEHALLVAVLRLAAAGRLDEREGVAQVDGHALFSPLQLDSSGDLALADPSTPP